MEGFPELTIGEVARRAGVATSSIRYYERIGLLPPPERTHGQRRYDARACSTSSAFIGVAQSAGFKLTGDQGADRRRREARWAWASRCAPCRGASSSEVEALLERTQAMKHWLEDGEGMRLHDPEECALFSPALATIRVEGSSCRRDAEPAS